MLNDFAKMLKDLVGSIVKGMASSSEDWDRQSYESVVRLLVLKDEIAVKEGVDHLIKEGKLLAIPPIYLASQRHPNLTVRTYCWNSLQKLDSHANINRVIAGKDLEEGLSALIGEYGHFKDDYH